MGLLSIFQRSQVASAPGESPADVIARARAQARRRLIGAVVLLAAGLVAFPMLFETKPRALATDVSIVVPRKDAQAEAASKAPEAKPAAPKAAAEKPAADKPVSERPVSGKPAADKPSAASKPVAAAVAAAAVAPGTAPAAQRLVVQVGAFADAAAAREARQRVEKLGIKTFVQEVQVDGGKRIRVRVGPFTDRDEADKQAARIKAAGLSAAVLAL
jgi:DedD protein